MIKFYRVLIAVISLLLLISFQNCENFNPTHQEGNEHIDLLSQAESQAVEVLKTNCASCHAGRLDSPQPKNILDFYTLTEEGYISLGYPQNSTLYLDMIDGVLPHEGQPELSESEVNAIRVWLLGINANSDDLASVVGGDGEIDGGLPPARFSEVFSQIIQPRCLNCHGAGGPNSNLSNYNGVRAHVAPGNPAASDLFNRVATGNMPQTGAPLSASQKFMIQSWIKNGARND